MRKIVNNIKDYRARGRYDAAFGYYELPHDLVPDNSRQIAENNAYREGYKARMRELAKEYKWEER